MFTKGQLISEKEFFVSKIFLKCNKKIARISAKNLKSGQIKQIKTFIASANQYIKVPLFI